MNSLLNALRRWLAALLVPADTMVLGRGTWRFNGMLELGSHQRVIGQGRSHVRIAGR